MAGGETAGEDKDVNGFRKYPGQREQKNLSRGGEPVTADRDGWDFSEVLGRRDQKKPERARATGKIQGQRENNRREKIFSFLLFLHSRV